MRKLPIFRVIAVVLAHLKIPTAPRKGPGWGRAVAMAGVHTPRPCKQGTPSRIHFNTP